MQKGRKAQTRVRRRAFVLFLALLFSFGAARAKESRILTDAQQGKISRLEALRLYGLRMFAPERLPQRYQAEARLPLKCGTEIVRALKENWALLKPEDRKLFSRYFQRPVLPYSYVSPEGRFRLHYALGGYDGVPRKDADSSGVPDFIERAGEYLDYSYHFEVDTLGYQPPPSDYGVDGDEIDVYFKNINAYGYTDFDRQIPETPYNDWTSYITMDNDFAGPGYYAQGLDGLRVTCAHELFHVIQLGYNYRDEDLFFFEMSSTWMEDRVYDDVNDYQHYIHYYLDHIDWPLSLANGYREYGASIFLKFIQENYSDDVIRRAWEHIRQEHSIKALDASLREVNSSFAEAFITFGLWNYFTGDRSTLAKFYREGDQYPQVQFNRSYVFQSDTTLLDSTYSLSLKYYGLTPQQSGFYTLQQNHAFPSIWRTGVIIDRPTGIFMNSFSGSADGNLDFLNGFQDVTLIAANVQIPATLGDLLMDYQSARFQYVLRRQKMKGSLRVFPNPFQPAKHTILSVRARLPKTGNYECFIFSEAGRFVRRIPLRLFPEGEAVVQIPWDGTDENGREVASGIYLCVLASEKVRVLAKFALVR